jgi:predicted TPR repeat methyltransferase
MTENWDDFAGGWEKNADVILFSEKALESLLNVLNPEGLRVLDLGCGTGLLTEKLATNASQVIGIDPSEKMISALNKKNLQHVFAVNSELSDDLIRSNNLFLSKFDLVVASSVCAFLPDYEGTVNLVKRILVPNGLFVQWDWLKSGGSDDFGLTEERIESAFATSGLKLQSMKKAFTMQGDQGPMAVLMGVAKNA